MKWLLGLGVLCWSLQAHAEALPTTGTVALVTDKACADFDVESAFAKELRIRLPDMALTVGAIDAQATWSLHWKPRGKKCWLELRGPEAAELEIPNPAKQGDLELAASQVAWIVTMSVQQSAENEAVEPAPPVAEISEIPTDPPLPPPLPKSAEIEPIPEDPPPEPVVQIPVDPGQTVSPNDDVVEGGFVFTLFPGLSFPDQSSRAVPGMALELVSPDHYGISGIEVAWFYASAGFVDGIQMAMGSARTRELRGYQLSLGYNGADDVDGLQLTMGANNADRVAGFQVAFGANIADKVEGFQIAVGVNIADNSDVQIATVNVSDRASVQIGWVNISETSDVPIGLVNIMTDEPVFGIAWAGSTGLVAAGVLHGGKRFRYGYVLAGMPPNGTDGQVFGFGLGASLHFDLESWFFDTEIYGFQLSKDPLKQNFMLNLRGIVGWQILDRFAVFAGPALVSYWSGALDGLGVQPDYSVESLGAPGTANRWNWAEIQVGVRF